MTSTAGRGGLAVSAGGLRGGAVPGGGPPEEAVVDSVYTLWESFLNTALGPEEGFASPMSLRHWGPKRVHTHVNNPYSLRILSAASTLTQGFLCFQQCPAPMSAGTHLSVTPAAGEPRSSGLVGTCTRLHIPCTGTRTSTQCKMIFKNL